MFFSHDLLNPRHPVGQIWLAAHRKLKSKQDFLQAIQCLPDCIRNVIETRLMNEKEAQQNGGVPHSLRSASVLMYGCVVVYSKQIDFLKDESQHALSTIQQSSQAANVDLPAAATGQANAVTLPPASEVEYENLAYLANTRAFRFVREGAPSAINTLLPDPFEGAFQQPASVFDEDFFGMVEASTSNRSGQTPEPFRARSQSAEAPENFRAAGDPEQPNWRTAILESPFAMPGLNNDDAMDYGQPAGGDYEHEPVGEAGDRLSAGQPLDHHGFTPGSIGGDSLPGAPGADLPGQEATFKTPQSAKAKKGKSPAKGTPGAEAAGSTPGKGALRQKHKSPVGPKRRKIEQDKDNVCLKNKEIREFLQDASPILTAHPTIPGTAAAVLLQRLQQGERLLEFATRPVIASAALDVPLASVHPALQRYYQSRLGAAGAVADAEGAAAAAAAEAAAGPSTGKKRRRGSQEGAEQFEQQGGDWDGGAGPGPNDNFFDDEQGPALPYDDMDGARADGESLPPASNRRRGQTPALSEGADDDEGRVHFLDGLEDAAEYSKQDRVHEATQNLDGWSERTRSALTFVQRRFKKEGVLASNGKGKARAEKGITLSSIIGREHRLQASIMFFELLVLQNKKFVSLDQQAPFGEVTIRPGAATMEEMAA